MEIHGNGTIHDKAASLIGAQPVPADAVRQGQEKSVAASKDSVELSSHATILREGSAILAAVPDIRLQPVTEMKDRIESGTYQVKGEQVSDAIIRETLLDATL